MTPVLILNSKIIAQGGLGLVTINGLSQMSSFIMTIQF